MTDATADAPLVSVVTRVGDDPAALTALAERLRGQSLSAWEWLLVDDGRAAGVTDALAAADARIRVVTDPGANARARWTLDLAPTDLALPTDLETRLWVHTTGGRSNGVRISDELPFRFARAAPAPRLLLLVPWLDAGGAEKFNLDLLRQLAARGWTCTVATTLAGRDTWEAEFRARTPDVFVLPRFLPLADYPRFLRHLLAARAVDVVLITHSFFAYLALPYLRAHFPNTAFVDYCHVVEPDSEHGGYPAQAVAHQELLDLSVVSSNHLRAWMVDHGADGDRIAVCTINVDPERWRPDGTARARVGRALGLDPDTPIILHAARLCPQKQPAVLAEALRRLRDGGTRFTALIAGDGPDRALLQGLVTHYGLGNHVRLLGLVPNDGMRELLQAADVFFLPSRYEGIALALFEAMACGVCVVSADVGGQRELVTPESGVLIPPGSADDQAARYAGALRALLADPARRRSLGTAGRARVQAHFDLRQMGDRMHTLLTDALRGHATAPRLSAGPALARAFAEQAVTCARASALAGAIDPYQTDWRTHAYFAVRNLLLPAYDRLTRAHTWPVTLKNALKAAWLRS